MRAFVCVALLLLPLAAVGQTSLPPCPTDTKVRWHNCLGSITFPNGEKYVGEFSDDRYHGQGTYTYPDGLRYSGQYVNGKRNGQGTFTWPNGDRFVGLFRDGSRHLGTYLHQDGARYIGEYKDDRPNGQGTYIYPNGSKYVGEFRGGVSHGQGIYYSANGVVVQSGRWEDDKLVQSYPLNSALYPFQTTGTVGSSTASSRQTRLPPCPPEVSAWWHNCWGTISSPKGEKYVGEFRDNKFHGQGTYTYPDGLQYVGEFSEGMYHGKGTMNFPSGANYAGDFRLDKFHGRGIYTFPSGAKFEGEYKNGKRDGKGSYTYPEGEKFVGEFRDGKYHGQGILYSAGGTVVQSGRWEDDRLVQSFVLSPALYPFQAPGPSSPAESGNSRILRAEAAADFERRKRQDLERQLAEEKKRREDAERRVGANTPESSGTGFLVSPGLLVTNQHVVSGCKKLDVLSADGRRSAVILDADESVDLALLRVTGIGGSAATLRRAGSLRLGEPAYVFGFPLSGLLSEGGNFTNGVVSSLKGLRDSASEFQMTTPVQPGNSGGAVLDSSGNVIGVVVGKLNAAAVARTTGDIPQNVNFAVSLNALRAFLDHNKVNIRSVERGSPIDATQLATLARAMSHRILCSES